MKREDRVVGALLLLFSLAVLFESSKLPMVYVTTTGPGFFPFWLSVAMAVFSALIFLGGFRRSVRVSRKISWPDARGLRIIAAIIAALLLYTLGVSILGYIVSTFVFMWSLVWLLGSFRWYWSVTIGLATAVCMYLLFNTWLGMSLPTGFLSIP